MSSTHNRATRPSHSRNQLIFEVVPPLHSSSSCAVDGTRRGTGGPNGPRSWFQNQERGMKRIVNIVGVAAAMLWLAGPASATPVTFQGGVFDVTVSDLGG